MSEDDEFELRRRQAQDMLGRALVALESGLGTKCLLELLDGLRTDIEMRSRPVGTLDLAEPK